MRDGIALARSGIPAIALVTEAFWPQGNFVARSLGMPGVPRVKLPHPVAGTGRLRLEQVAAAVVPDILTAFEQGRGQDD